MERPDTKRDEGSGSEGAKAAQPPSPRTSGHRPATRPTRPETPAGVLGTRQRRMQVGCSWSAGFRHTVGCKDPAHLSPAETPRPRRGLGLGLTQLRGVQDPPRSVEDDVSWKGVAFQARLERNHAILCSWKLPSVLEKLKAYLPRGTVLYRELSVWEKGPGEKKNRVLSKNSNCTVTCHAGETGVWCRQGLRARGDETLFTLQGPFNTPWSLPSPTPLPPRPW